MDFLEVTYAYYKKEGDKTIYFDSKKPVLINKTHVITIYKYHDYENIFAIETTAHNNAYPLIVYSTELGKNFRSGEF
jgi:hypothetical protein